MLRARAVVLTTAARICPVLENPSDPIAAVQRPRKWPHWRLQVLLQTAVRFSAERVKQFQTRATAQQRDEMTIFRRLPPQNDAWAAVVQILDYFRDFARAIARANYVGLLVWGMEFVDLLRNFAQLLACVGAEIVYARHRPIRCR
jgi:hypothetical protein